MGRKRKITLKQAKDLGSPAKRYEVVTLIDSVEFDIGQDLTEKEVDDLCADKDWTVTVRG